VVRLHPRAGCPLQFDRRVVLSLLVQNTRRSEKNLNDVALRYNKNIILVETAYAFTADDNDNYEKIIRTEKRPGYPFTFEGQAKTMSDIMDVIRAIPNGRGLGVMWWDATWTAVPGNGWDPAHPEFGNNWENQALFDFDNRALPAMKLFNRPGSCTQDEHRGFAYGFWKYGITNP